MQVNDSNDNWKLVRKLGSGSFGQVLLWRNLQTNEEIATKSIKQNNTLREDERAKIKERWLKECEWMRNMNTPAIVRGVDISDSAFVDMLNKNHEWKPLPVIVMEYCNSGDLRSKLLRPEYSNGLQERDVREILRALCNAIEYLHDVCNIEHRDLKPDNIVIHKDNKGKNYYKLTDFGFARQCSESTILKSVVGTRHYFAPEVVDTSQYTKTVDYWSAGVIAFELMTGCLPFIPHQVLYKIITNIKAKPRACIAITENLKEDDRFIFEPHVFPETIVSEVFRTQMEMWLRIALDTNYKTRGLVIPLAADEVHKRNSSKQEPDMGFYTLLNQALTIKVLRIFCLNTCQFHTYEVKPNTKMVDLLAEFRRDTKLENISLIFPVGHPCSARNGYQPIDLYVPDWDAEQDDQMPSAMVYLVDPQCPFSDGAPHISSAIKVLMNLNENATILDWKLRLYAQHTHFLISTEQSRLVALINGLREYAMTVEHETLNYDRNVQDLLSAIDERVGSVDQFCGMIYAARAANRSFPTLQSATSAIFFENWESRVIYFKSKINEIRFDVGHKIRRRYSSALRRIREQAINPQWKRWSQQDFYSLTSFRHQYESGKLGLKWCEEAIDHCLKAKSDFFSNKEFKSSRDVISQVFAEYVLIKATVKKADECLRELQCDLVKETETFQLHLCEISANIPPQLSCDSASQPINDEDIDKIFDSPTMELLKDAVYSMQLLQMDVDHNLMDTEITKSHDEERQTLP